MSRRTITLFISLGVVLLLGVGYNAARVWQTRQAAPEPFEPTPILGNFRAREIVKIEVPGITLERKGGIWELTYLEGGPLSAQIKLDQMQVERLTFSLANVWVDRIIEEEPEDLAMFGLANPLSQTIVTDSTGRQAVFLLGYMNPSRTHFYVMEKGDPRVYTVSTFVTDSMLFTLDDIRQRRLFSPIPLQNLTKFRLETTEHVIEINTKPDDVPPHLTFSFTNHLLVSPYKLPRGANAENLNVLLNILNNLAIQEFIDDNPSSLRPFGLDQPARIKLQSNDSSLDLLVGSPVNGRHYAKLYGAPNVFTLGGMTGILNIRPVSLIDRFIILLSIDKVERLTISGGENDLNVDFYGQGENMVFYLNGRRAEDRSFRTFYQAVIGLLVDAEIPRTPGPVAFSPDENDRTIFIEFMLNTPPGHSYISLIPYNRDFYALLQGGEMEFLIARSQVRRIFEAADAVSIE